MLRDDGHFHISSFCATSTCVGVALEGEIVAISNRSNPEAPTVRCHRDEWAAFLAGVKNGEFDLPDT